MPRALNDDERNRIIELLSEGLSHAAIGAKVGRAASTVGNVARSIGHRSGQTNLARAHEARSAYSAERRAIAGAMAGQRLEELLAAFLEAQPVVVSTPKGPRVLEVAPDARAQRDRAAAVQTLMKTILDVDRHDNRAEEGAAAVDEWLRGMLRDEGAS